MKPVITYENFRLYIQDFYNEYRERFGFTWRKFASKAGYASPVFLKLVSENKANLSQVGIERTAQAMDLVGKDLLYFRELVNFNQQKKPELKKIHYQKMLEIASEAQVSLISEKQFEYFSSWRNPVLRELVEAFQNLSPAEYASLFIEKTSANDVKKAINTLIKTELIQKTEKNKYTKTNQAISTGNLEVASMTIRAMHQQMGKLALNALENIDPEERDFSGLTFSVTDSAAQRIKNEIAEFRKRLMSIIVEDSGFDKVYRLNMQLFPLTKNLHSKESQP